MTREEAIRILRNIAFQFGSVMREDNITAVNMAIEALSADTVSREEYEEVKAYMDTLVDAFIEDGEELAESVKVVRCKDCKWWNYGEDCVRHTEDTMGYTISTMAYDFCSYGERREK